AARRAEPDVVGMRGDATAARDLTEPAIPLEDLLLDRALPLENWLPDRAEVLGNHPEALVGWNRAARLPAGGPKCHLGELKDPRRHGHPQHPPRAHLRFLRALQEIGRASCRESRALHEG